MGTAQETVPDPVGLAPPDMLFPGRRLAEDFLNKNAFVTLTVGTVGAATDTIQQTVLYSRDQNDKYEPPPLPPSCSLL